MNSAQLIKASRNLVKQSALGLAAAAMLGVGTHANAAPPVTSGLVLALDASARSGWLEGDLGRDAAVGCAVISELGFNAQRLLSLNAR